MGLTELVRLAVGIDGNWSGFLHQRAVLVRIPAGDGGIGQIFFESCGKNKTKKNSPIIVLISTSILSELCSLFRTGKHWNRCRLCFKVLGL